MHRPRHPSELEARFQRPVEPAVVHRLPLAEQASLEEALGRTREAHLQIHQASAVLAEAIEGQQFTAQARAAGRHLQQTIAAAGQALEALQ